MSLAVKANLLSKDTSMIINFPRINKNPLGQLSNLRIKARHELIKSFNKSNLSNQVCQTEGKIQLKDKRK